MTTVIHTSMVRSSHTFFPARDPSMIVYAWSEPVRMHSDPSPVCSYQLVGDVEWGKRLDG